MQLNLTTDYAISIILYLMNQGKTSSTDLSENLGISQKYIKKLLSSSNLSKFVETRAGRNGGLELRDQAKDISLFDVIKEMENTVFIDSCSGDENKCEGCSSFCKNSCPIRTCFKNIEQIMEEDLKEARFDKFSNQQREESVACNSNLKRVK